MDLDELQTGESEPEAAAVEQEEETAVEVQSSGPDAESIINHALHIANSVMNIPGFFGDSRLFAE